MGDPTFIGWTITLLYLLGAFQCAVVFRRTGARLHWPPLERGLWFGLALLLLGLGLNKQLDIHDHIVKFLREVAQAQGWYEHRRKVQWIFLALFGSGLIIFLAALFHHGREAWRRHRLALAGVMCLGLFILMRATHFNHLMEDWLNRAESFHLNDLCEGGGILLIAWAAQRALVACPWQGESRLAGTLTSPSDGNG